MQGSQKINCKIKSCKHYKNGDMCALNSVQIFPCNDESHAGHDTVCYSYQPKQQ
ncbi:MAG: DUF1540 domain-containing protein [Bacillota bacterium]|nr:DUF1540 domain-containing protein [Bacillota bacterium]